MTGWVVAATVVMPPLALFLLLLITALVESRLVAPAERASTVVRALDGRGQPDDIEQLVTGLAEQAMPAAGPPRAPGRGRAESTDEVGGASASLRTA